MRLSPLYSLLLSLNLAGFPAVAALALIVGVSSTPISIAMRTLIVALSLALVVAALLRMQAAFVRGWYWVPILVFWTIYLARIVHATTTESHLLARPPEDYWLWAFGACFIPMLALLIRPSNSSWAHAYRGSFVLIVIGAFIIAVYGDTNVNPESGWEYDTGRLRLEALNPISVGHLGVSLILLSVWPLLTGREAVGRWWSAACIAAAALGVYLAVAAASRGPLVALVMVAMFYVSALNTRLAWRSIAFFVVVVAIGYGTAVQLEQAGQSSTLSRFVEGLEGTDISISSRQYAISGALAQFAHSPVFGDALEEWSLGFYPHNVIVESLMATGIVGGMAFVAFLAYGVRCAFGLIKARSPHAWVALIMIQSVVGAQFSGALYGVTTMWAYLAATIALSHATRLSTQSRLVTSDA